MIIIILTGCAGTSVPAESPTQDTIETTQIANPWVGYTKLQDAEEAVGFPLDIPETIADTYHAEEFRIMNGELLEVIYRDGDEFEVRVRKKAGEGEDISGNYNEYPDVSEEALPGGNGSMTTKTDGKSWQTLVSCDGYSWSLYAENGYWGDSATDFIDCITAAGDLDAGAE